MSSAGQSDDAECPTCGRMFGSENGMKVHHAKAHSKSIAGVTCKCEFCGDDFRAQQSRVDERQCCSFGCLNKWQSENRTGENSPTWKGGPVEFDCDWCGETDEKIRAEYERLDHHFCSIECDSAWKSEHNSGENSVHWKGGPVKFDCDWCGEKTEKPQCHFDRNEHNFCSEECGGAWKSEHKSGENSAHWKGGYLSLWGKNWKKQQRQTRERDDHICQRCGDDDDNRRLAVHHLIPRRLFLKWDIPNIEDSNVPRNLISLCRNCHQTIEKGNVTSPVPESHWRSE